MFNLVGTCLGKLRQKRLTAALKVSCSAERFHFCSKFKPRNHASQLNLAQLFSGSLCHTAAPQHLVAFVHYLQLSSSVRQNTPELAQVYCLHDNRHHAVCTETRPSRHSIATAVTKVLHTFKKEAKYMSVAVLLAHHTLNVRHRYGCNAKHTKYEKQ